MRLTSKCVEIITDYYDLTGLGELLEVIPASQFTMIILLACENSWLARIGIQNVQEYRRIWRKYRFIGKTLEPSINLFIRALWFNILIIGNAGLLYVE